MRERTQLEPGQVTGAVASPEQKALCQLFGKLCHKDFPSDECDTYDELCPAAEG